MTETMKLLGSAKRKIDEDKNSENLPHLKVTEVLVSIVMLTTMIINRIQESCIHLLEISHLVN